MTIFIDKLKEKAPQAKKLFNDWFIERVVIDDYPSSMNIGGLSAAFNDWPFKLQCMYFVEFLRSYDIEMTLSRIEEERFKAVLLVGFQELENYLNSLIS